MSEWKEEIRKGEKPSLKLEKLSGIQKNFLRRLKLLLGRGYGFTLWEMKSIFRMDYSFCSEYVEIFKKKGFLEEVYKGRDRLIRFTPYFYALEREQQKQAAADL